MHPKVVSPTCGENELIINLGRTWNGLEFLRIRKLKRKPGCRVDFLERRWSGRWRTIWSWHCLTVDDVLTNLRQYTFLELEEEDVERLKEFFGGGA